MPEFNDTTTYIIAEDIHDRNISDSDIQLHSTSPPTNATKKWSVMGELRFFYDHLTLSELSGSLGDLGTLLPILVGLSATGQVSLTSSLVLGGVFNIITGFTYRVPMCVQPMKAIGAVALASKLSLNQIVAAGFCVSGVVLILAITQTLTVANRLIPLPVIRGIQLGTGLNLINKGVQSILAGERFSLTSKGFNSATDNFIIAFAAFVLGMISYRWKRNPTALLLFVYGMVVASITVWVVNSGRAAAGTSIGPSFPTLPVVPSPNDFKIGFINAALGQIPLTLLNSVIAVSKLADDLYPERPKPVASITSIGLGVGALNIVGMWFGSIPYCHGSGGLAAQHRFGARTHVGVVILGLGKLTLGLIFGSGLLPLFQAFPNTILGVMLIFAGVELGSAAKDIGGVDRDGADSFIVALVTGSIVAGWQNDGVGFIVGIVACFCLWAARRTEMKESVWAGVVEHFRQAFYPSKKDKASI
ncbi:hypothetical protein HDV05_000651 [Chytridiales sp. JEL 0842]|nr:hypothetical protein HDV05_000651 [Chytridiales sp. JEL 0842]